MLEVKKELLDEKIHQKEVEEQRKEFLEAVTKGRIQWQQEKVTLEKELKEAREKVAELKGKLNLKEDIMKKLNSAHLNSRARSPSLMPKEERVAVVDAMMEVVGVRNEVAAQALFMKRLNEQNRELNKKISDLEEENMDMKQEIEKRRLQAVSMVEENEEGRTEVKDLFSEKQEDEEWRAELQDRTSKSQREEER